MLCDLIGDWSNHQKKIVIGDCLKSRFLKSDWWVIEITIFHDDRAIPWRLYRGVTWSKHMDAHDAIAHAIAWADFLWLDNARDGAT